MGVGRPERFFPWLEPIVAAARTCLQCGECETRCPYQLPIREALAAGIAFFKGLR